MDKQRLSNEFLGVMNGIQNHYSAPILAMINSFVDTFCDNIFCIIAYGGIIRDKSVIDGWSDIDIMILYNDIKKRNYSDVMSIKKKFERISHLRLDLNEIDIDELRMENHISICINGEYCNVLQFRKDVSMLVYGDMPLTTISYINEYEAAVNYLATINLQLRKFIVDNDPSLASLTRCIKWIFSMVRSALRLFEIFCHPYEESIYNIKRIFPKFDFSLLDRLVLIRKCQVVVDNEYCSNLINDIEKFNYAFMSEVKKNTSKGSVEKWNSQLLIKDF